MNHSKLIHDPLPYDEEIKEAKRMKEACDRLVQDSYAMINETLEMIDRILSKEAACAEAISHRHLAAEELDVLMHGTKKLEP